MILHVGPNLSNVPFFQIAWFSKISGYPRISQMSWFFKYHDFQEFPGTLEFFKCPVYFILKYNDFPECPVAHDFIFSVFSSILASYWPTLALCWPILALCWPILNLWWPILEPRCPQDTQFWGFWNQLREFWGSCWRPQSIKSRCSSGNCDELVTIWFSLGRESKNQVSEMSKNHQKWIRHRLKKKYIYIYIYM